jgi:glycosyltransferase involved in cell wall biosynthesis
VAVSGNKIVVAHIILSLEIGGMEQVVVDLVKAMDRSRFEPVVVCIQKLGPLADELKALGVAVMEVPPMVPVLSLLYPTALIKVIRSTGTEVIHVHSGCWFKGVMAARICGAKNIIYTLHGATYARTLVLKFMERIAARLTSAIIAVSDDLAGQLRNAGHIPMEKVSVIINGIDTDKFSAVQTRANGGPVHIGTIARLEEVKDIGTLLRAFRILIDAGVEAVLDIAGDGSERETLQQLASELGIREKVNFLGFRRDTPQLLAAMDIFALSSLSEGTSISMIEAMAAGKPVVATRVGGNTALIEEGVNGFLVNAKDHEALAAALIHLVQDKSLVDRMGHESRRRALSLFSAKVMTKRYEKLYTS